MKFKFYGFFSVGKFIVILISSLSVKIVIVIKIYLLNDWKLKKIG